MAATPVRRKSSAPDSGPSAEAYDPKLAKSEAVQLGLRGAMSSAVAVLIAMCLLAAGVSLLIIYIVPPPGAADLAGEMPWTRLHPFRPEHGTARVEGTPPTTTHACAVRLRQGSSRRRLHRAAVRCARCSLLSRAQSLLPC